MGFGRGGDITYTVSGDEQSASEMFLEYRVQAVDGHWSADEINIAVSIMLKDGTTQERKLLVTPNHGSTTRNVQISLAEAP